MRRYQSNAEWSEIEPTTDQHRTEKAAQAVCDLLLRDYTINTPCESRGACTKAYVTEIESD